MRYSTSSKSACRGALCCLHLGNVLHLPTWRYSVASLQRRQSLDGLLCTLCMLDASTHNQVRAGLRKMETCVTFCATE